MPSRSEIEKNIAALQAQLDGADTDDEVWIKDGDREIKVSGKRATAILGRYSDMWKDDDADADAADDTDDVQKDAKPARESLFKGKAK